MNATKLRRRLTIRAAFISLMAISPVAIAQPPKGNTEPALNLQWEQLRHDVFTHRQSQLQLARVRELIDTGNYAVAFEALQKGILGNPQTLMDLQSRSADSVTDSFYWDGRQLRSVRREAMRLLESMPARGQREYEKLWAPVADKALEAAVRSGSLSDLMEISRRCFATAAGARALDMAATKLLDQGQPATAAACWQQLIDSPLHSSRLYPGLFRKAAAAWLLSHEAERADKVAAEGRRHGFSVELADLREAVELLALVQNEDARTGWPLPFGNHRNNPVAQGSVPYLNPLWTQTLTGLKSFDALTSLERSLVRSELKVMGSAVWPIIARDQLIVRDLDGIRSCDPLTGRQLWRFNGRLSSRELAGRMRATGFSGIARGPDKSVEYAWTEASGTGCITSDGDRIFAIDWIDMGVDQDVGSIRGRSRFTAANRIVCLRIPDEIPAPVPGTPDVTPRVIKPVWSAGGSSSNTLNDPLAGQFFVAPPLPMAGAVFVMSESLPTQELNLVKLEAATGRLIWIQKLGLVERSLFELTQRHRLNPVSVPACSDNIIICPTEARYVVAVDAISGELLWMYDYSDRAPTFRNSTRGQEKGFRGMPDPPHIQGNSVLLLPRRSDYVHCVDQRTGERVWRTKRNDDLYVAAVTETVVAMVGKGGMRGLSLRTGEDLWSTRLGLPSGRGVRTQLDAANGTPPESGDAYLVPLKRGGIAAVNLETGQVETSTLVPSILESRLARHLGSDDPGPRPVRELDMQLFGLGTEHTSDEARPGNLLLHDGLAISVGARHLTAFAQVDDHLAGLRAAVQRKEFVDPLELAQVEVAAGDLETAEERLSALVQNGDRQAERARWLLQELLRMQLASPDPGVELTIAEQRDMVTRLTTLAKSPCEKEQALIHFTRFQQQHGSAVNAVPQVASIASLGLNSFISVDPYAEQVVTSDAWGRSLILSARQQASPQEWQAVTQQVEQHRHQALQTDTIASLEQFIAIYAALPEAGPVRNQLADRLIQQGRFQSAELLLIQNRKSPDDEVRAVAEVLLLCLWDRLGINIEAGQALRRVASEFNDTSLESITRDHMASVSASLTDPLDDATGRGFLAAFDKSSLSWRVFKDLQPLSWRVRRVQVSGQGLAGANPDAPGVWRKVTRRVDNSPTVGFDLVGTDGGTDGRRTMSRWVLLDRLSGANRAEVLMPQRSQLPMPRYRYVGHLMPVGGKTEMHAVSLLESRDGNPFWRHHFRPVESVGRASNDAIEPSVATPSVFVFQTVKHLMGIEPRSGRVLWRRSNLDLESGVRVDREAGLFGDDETLTLFHKDTETYSILSSQTGETIRTDTANVDFRYPKRVFGRQLFHVTNEITAEENNPSRRIRVWDPTRKGFDFDEEVVGRLNFASSSNGEMALLIGQTLQVFRMPEMDQIASIEFAPADLTRFTTLRMFSDDQNVYLNLQERMAGLSSGRNNIYLAGDSSIPLNSVFRGSLMAVEKASGKILWKRSIQQRSMLNITQCSLPFLIGLARVSPQGNNTQRALAVELIDRQTGETLGYADRLIPDRIVHCAVDRDRGLLTLHGLSSRIDLDFSRSTQSLLLEQQPL